MQKDNDQKQKPEITPIDLHLKWASLRKENHIYQGDFAAIGLLANAWLTHTCEIKVTALKSAQLTNEIKLYHSIVCKLSKVATEMAKTDETLKIINLLGQAKDIFNSFSEIKGQKSCPLVGKPGNELECEFVRTYIKVITQLEKDVEAGLKKSNLNFIVRKVISEFLSKFKADNQVRIKVCQKSIDEFQIRALVKADKIPLGQIFMEKQAAEPKTSKISASSLASLSS